MSIFDRSDHFEVAELTWENGQITMHGLSGPLQSNHAKPTWCSANETLESIVHQATNYQQEAPQELQQCDHAPGVISSMVASSYGNWMADNSSAYCVPVPPFSAKKCIHPEPMQCETNFFGCIQDEQNLDLGACASASANGTATTTWTSFHSSQGTKTKTKDEDSASRGRAENHDYPETKAETIRSQSTRRGRDVTVHNQSERRRRDRINQKLKALQKLVPNASKTDKASMLDEVIEYLKQLQAQVQVMNTMRNMTQMMMPIGTQQQELQMAMLARMGMGMNLGLGMGMLDKNPVTRAPPISLSLLQPNPASTTNQTFAPSLYEIPTHNPAQANTGHANSCAQPPLPDPYCAALIAQSMNMDMHNKMAAAIYQQQVNQNNQAMAEAIYQQQVNQNNQANNNLSQSS